MFKYILGFCLFIVGCSDHQITATKSRIEYIEVPGETKYIEVPTPYPYPVNSNESEYGEIWVDSFVQPQSTDGIDILWVIDTSGSMSRFDATLLDGIEAMLNALPETGWRLAMASNDPPSASVEDQFPLIPGDDIDDALDMYNYMYAGQREEGFDAAYEYIVNNSYAQTWLRTDAALLIVFVSDEEDQSDDRMFQVSDFTSWFSGLRNGSVYVSSIVNVDQADSICSSNPLSSDVGYRYMEATNYFSGVVIDICSKDWSAGVSDTSTKMKPFEYLGLTYIPVDSDYIRVFIDGQLDFNWYYDMSDNTVYFSDLPQGNALVEIAYYYEPEKTGS